MLFHANAEDIVVPISFKSNKARRLTRSAISGEFFAFIDMIYISISLSEELEAFVNQRVPLQMLTERKSLFTIVSKGSRESEKRTMLEVAPTKDAEKVSMLYVPSTRGALISFV